MMMTGMENTDMMHVLARGSKEIMEHSYALCTEGAYLESNTGTLRLKFKV